MDSPGSLWGLWAAVRNSDLFSTLESLRFSSYISCMSLWLFSELPFLYLSLVCYYSPSFFRWPLLSFYLGGWGPWPLDSCIKRRLDSPSVCPTGSSDLCKATLQHPLPSAPRAVSPAQAMPNCCYPDTQPKNLSFTQSPSLSHPSSSRSITNFFFNFQNIFHVSFPHYPA